ncbi:hypothetical protein ACFV7Q_21365 [Streptomyces sp. NPDC059851]|uniref:hypothetical protein n=1 Tax=Streptomyces sp. NPDC059851 TaxID=3346971 RepID=UPI003656DC50
MTLFAGLDWTRAGQTAVITVCLLADTIGHKRGSGGAVEDEATALEVLAGAGSGFSPEAAEISEVIPATALLARQACTRDSRTDRPADRTEDPAGAEYRPGRALAAHSLTGHQVHMLGLAVLTVTLDAAHAQALAVLLTARPELPCCEDALRWGAPAETAAASLAVALAAYGRGPPGS